MVDRKVRDRALRLVTQLRAGEITTDDFTIPRGDGTDRALKAIDSILWRLYPDKSGDRLGESSPLTPDEWALVDRCMLFLTTDLEYEWPEDDFFGVAEYPRLLDFVSGGTLNTRATEKQRGQEERMTAAGDRLIWPFLRPSDLSEAQARRRVRPS